MYPMHVPLDSLLTPGTGLSVGQIVDVGGGLSWVLDDLDETQRWHSVNQEHP